ncbi:MAG: hypothetical protein ACO3SO_02150 [Luteolibacter sp.]
MKNLSFSGSARSQFFRWLYGCTAAMSIATAPLKGEVSVTFNNTDLLNTAGTSIGTVTLLFTVDGSGNVTLDASTNSVVTGAVAAVNAWDGAVGTITDSGAFNTTFTVTLKGVGNGSSSNDLRLRNFTGGSPVGGVIGIPGTNQYRVDNHLTGSENNEYIQLTATSVPAGSKLKLTAIGWNNSNGNYSMSVFRTAPPSISLTNPVTTQTGTWDLSTSGVLLDPNQVINFGTVANENANYGYSFKALGVDIVSASTLSAPAGLAATTDGAQVVLNWNDTTNATSYSVYRSTSSGGPYGAAIATGLATSDYTDNTVSTGTTYYYVVTASDGSTESANSAEVSIPVVIPAPTELTRIQGDSVINLDWADSTSPIFASYSVYRSTTSGSGYASIASGLTTSAYSDDTVTNGTTYYYVVRAVDNVASSESVNSAEVSGTPYAAVAGSTLYAHLDGSVSASVTKDGSDIVSLWADQTANGFNATSTGGVGTVYYPAPSQSESGLDGLDMGFTSGTPKSTLVWFSPAQQDQWLDFDSGAGALPYGGFAVFAAVHPDTVLGGVNRDVVMGSIESTFALRYEGGRPQVRLGTTVLQGTAGAVTVGQTVVLGVHYNATTGLLQLWDSESGATSSATVPAADFSSTANIFLGGSANPDQYMKGMLGEAMVYRGVMTPTEFGNQKASLALKWIGLQIPSGLTASSGAGTVVLEWDDQVADSFTVYRSEIQGGPYTPIATNVLTSDYPDTTVTEGTTYYYVVTATESTYGESPPSAEVAIIPYTSIAGNSLYVHLDATNAGSVSTTSNVVNVWQDLTANGNNATEVPNSATPDTTTDTGDVLYPGGSLSASGLAGLDFGPNRNLLGLFDIAAQDAWLDFSNVGPAKPYSGFAVFIALKADSILGAVAPNQARDVVFANTDNIDGKFLIRYQSGRPEMYLNGVAAVQGVNRVTEGDTVILAANYNAATGALEFWDSASGVAASATVPAADFSVGNNIMFLGGSSNVAQCMDGMIGEVKIYRGALDGAAFQAERDALVTKWIGGAGTDFAGWIAGTFANGTVTNQGPDDDDDGDGISNLLEFAIDGQDPTVPNASVGSFTGLELSFTKRAGVTGISYAIEESTDLGVGDPWAAVAATEDATSISYTLPGGPAKDFVRLKVTQP